MPVIISKENVAAWLDPKIQDAAAVREFFVPFSAQGMTLLRVSTRVNTPKNDDPECLIAA
jgi:putative SOS response-associated peptidase YedK